jgi:peptidoglycan/LPS O-acetylase OafA/YrhL
MREIVDIRTVERAVWVWAVACPVACLLAGGLMVALGRGAKPTIIKAVLLALLGPLILGLWLSYSYLVRYDPRTGYFGLDKLWVLAVNLCLFAVVGTAYGYLVGRAWGPRPARASEAEAAPDRSRLPDSEPEK